MCVICFITLKVISTACSPKYCINCDYQQELVFKSGKGFSVKSKKSYMIEEAHTFKYFNYVILEDFSYL